MNIRHQLSLARSLFALGLLLGVLAMPTRARFLSGKISGQQQLGIFFSVTLCASIANYVRRE